MTVKPTPTQTTQAKPDTDAKLRSPSGINLAPDPPNAVTISKKALLIGVLGLAGVIGMVLLGMYGRQHHQVEMNQRTGEDLKPSAATSAARELVNEIAPASSREKSSVGNPSSSTGLHGGFKVPVLKPPEGFANSSSATTWQAVQPQSARSELSAEEKLRVEDYERERQAIAAPTLIKTSGFHNAEVTSATQSENVLASELGALAQATANRGNGGGLEEIATALRGGSASAAAGESTASYERQNQQDQKREFNKSGSRSSESRSSDYLETTRTLPLGKYEIKSGWDIPATLEQAVNSDLPGEVKALVRSNVYDTATGNYLLIPQGARMVGTYNSRIAYGQRGVQVVWSRIIYPDGSSLDLGASGMPGSDTAGNAGFSSSVDNHYRRLIGFAALTSLFSAGLEIAQNGTGGSSVLQGANAGQTVSAAVGQQLGELGVEVTRRNLNVQPTLRIPIGYRFNVRVNRDIRFDGPYSAAPL